MSTYGEYNVDFHETRPAYYLSECTLRTTTRLWDCMFFFIAASISINVAIPQSFSPKENIRVSDTYIGASRLFTSRPQEKGGGSNGRRVFPLQWTYCLECTISYWLTGKINSDTTKRRRPREVCDLRVLRPLRKIMILECTHNLFFTDPMISAESTPLH